MTAIALLAVLLACRTLASAGHQLQLSWWSPVAYLWHDAAVVLAFAVFETVLRRYPRVVWAAYGIVALYAVANIPIQRTLWTPLTWTMWRAAGGALSDSIRHDATWTNAAAVLAGLAAVATAPLACRRVPARPALAAVLLCAALGPLAAARVDTLGLERNAWTALAGPIALHDGASMASRDWRAGDAARRSGEDLTRLRGALAGRNVVLISLESTAARYLGIYGAAPDIAPNLSALARSGLVFENAYAVYPESIKGLFSILCSATPGFETNAESYGEVPCRSAAAVLRDRGYRTALFHSGRFEYLGMNGVIRNRGYDLLADAGDIGGRRDSSFGVDEPSTVARILEWIDAQRDRPFFLTYLPIAGHHPYESPAGGPFPDDDEFGRYRNAVHDGDAALGALRRGLEARGLDRRTAWVVLGDHGEAFGQHPGNYGHTFQLYDENVRVPYVIAAPGLFTQATRVRRVVSLLDTAPTLLDLVGLPIPASYEGASMLDGSARMALFFTDYSLPLVGLRDGPRKFIHDLRSGRSRMFDVEQDPDETIDLSPRNASDARRYADALGAWVGFIAARRQESCGTCPRARARMPVPPRS